MPASGGVTKFAQSDAEVGQKKSHLLLPAIEGIPAFFNARGLQQHSFQVPGIPEEGGVLIHSVLVLEYLQSPRLPVVPLQVAAAPPAATHVSSFP